MFDKKNFLYLLLTALALYACIQIAFYQEGILAVVQLSLSLMWLYVIPGFLIMQNIDSSLKYLEKILLGFAASYSLIGVISYLIGLLQLYHVKYNAIILPLLIDVVCIALWLQATKKKSKHERKAAQDSA